MAKESVDDLLYSASTAQTIINNYEALFEARDIELKGSDKTGILQPRKRFFSDIERIKHRYGVRATGTAFEVVFNGTDYKAPELYYIDEIGGPYDQLQYDYIEEWENNLIELSKLYAEEARRLREEEKARREEAKREREEKKNELKKEYQRARKSLLQKARRYGVSIPSANIQKPKRITAGSVRKLVRMRNRLK